MKKVTLCILSLLMMTLILASGCNKKSEEKSQIKDPESEQKVQVSKITFTSPAGFVEHTILTHFASQAYSYIVPKSPPEPPEYVIARILATVVYLPDFYNYINNSNYDGMRVYPAYDDATHELFVILCLTNSEQNLEYDFRSLQNDCSVEGSFNNQPPKIDPVTAHNKHFNFINRIKLFKLDQAPVPDQKIEHLLKYSRYYSKLELTRYLSQNLTSQNPPYAGYKIKFEIGYIPYELGFIFKERIMDQQYDANEMAGFTSIMHLLNDADEPIIDRNAIYVPPTGGVHDYRGRFLEVGSPCPPTCGDLHTLSTKSMKQ